MPGIPEALALLKKLSAPDLSAVLEQESKRIVAVAQIYPPAPTGSRYTRSYTLRDNWNPIPPRRIGGGWAAGAENDTAYGDYVMGDDQAAIHQGRWKTTDQIATEEEATVAAAIEREYHRIAGQ